jgi:hypothetical protein
MRVGFVLLLDGANEVPWNKGILKAPAGPNELGLLVTSQANLPSDAKSFEEWELPKTIQQAVKPLLQLYLGEAAGTDAYCRIGPTLLEGLESGYDVRLIESLHEDGMAAFPDDRIGLYRTVIARLFAPDEAEAGSRLYAFAWDLWLRGDRQFELDELDTSVKHALVTDRHRQSVTRAVDGQKHEFRHDQMRGYLAARHVAGAANQISVLAASEKQWPMGQKGDNDQLLVWRFLSAISDEVTKQRIYRWTLMQPESRHWLQVAFTSEQTTAMIA